MVTVPKVTTICGVVFDVVGTLVRPDPPVGVAYHAVGAHHGARLTVEEVTRRFREAFHSTLRRGHAEPHRTDEAAERTFWRSVVSDVFVELPASAVQECFEELYRYFASPAAWRVYADVVSTLKQLRQRGLKLAVASNFDARLHGVMAGHPELATIDQRFVSSEIGWRKPDRRFFAAVCDGLALDTAEVLYVGDEPDSDVAAAVAAGLRSVLICRSGTSMGNGLTDLTELLELLDPTAGPGRT